MVNNQLFYVNVVRIRLRIVILEKPELRAEKENSHEKESRYMEHIL